MKTLWICGLVVAVFALTLFVMPAMQERHAAEAKAADKARDCARAIERRTQFGYDRVDEACK